MSLSAVGSFYGHVIDVRTRLPVLSIVILQHWPLGDFKMIPLPIWSILTSPPYTCSFDLGASILLLVPPTAKLEEATSADHTNLSAVPLYKEKLETGEAVLPEPASENAQDADGEQYGAQNEIVRQREHEDPLLLSRMALTWPIVLRRRSVAVFPPPF